MKTRLAVRNFTQQLNEVSDSILIYCIGYETRSRFAAEQAKWLAANVIAIKYSEGQVLAFEKNLEFAMSSKFFIVSDLNPQIEDAIKLRIGEMRLRCGKARVAVDVSSMDRSLMARVLFTVTDELRDGETLICLYSASAFIEPTSNLVPIRALSAAHPELTGQVAPPDTHRVVLLGIGFEYGVSLNILETHEPDIAFIFRPNGIDPRFTGALYSANFGFDFGERNYEIIDYYLEDMAGAYDDIASLMATGKHDSSIVSVPMGPKILSAVMLLAGRLHQPHVSVLRYSIARVGNYSDILAAGRIIGVSVTVLRKHEHDLEMEGALAPAFG